jgi:hypothetical protein
MYLWFKPFKQVMKTEEIKDDAMSCQSTIDPSEWNGRTIEIDDAGTGDLVGDAFIGFRDTENGRIIFQSIPVGFYNQEYKDENRPMKHIVEIVKKGLKVLNHKKGDRILLCRGDCFNLVREYFDENEIYYEPAIVEGILQEAVEGRYVQHLRKLGISSRKLTTKAGAERYFISFNWVCRDFPNRERFVKTGFPSWKKKWRKIAIKRYKNYQRHTQYKKKNSKSKMLETPISVRNPASKQ